MKENYGQIELSVVVPCLNEQGNVDRVVQQVIDLFNKNSINGEIILINDGSADDTNAEINRLTKEFKNVVGHEHKLNLGIAEAWYSGLKMAQGDYVLTIDADLQYRPEDIEVLYKEIVKDNYDLVQGWRSEYRDRSLFRKILSRTLSHILNILFFTRLNDIKSGFVVYKRDVFLDILKDRKRYRNFQHFFILSALKKGYRLKQVPVTFYPREKGESFIKHPIFFSFKVLLDIPRTILDFALIKKK